MLWIGLTGGIASGKSTVSRVIRSKGFVVVDADELAREVVEVGQPALAEIQQAFGPSVVDANGLRRKEIADIVFKDATRLKTLEGIIHPHVRERTLRRKQQLAASGARMAFYDVPLLFEKKMEAMFDRIVLVSCSEETQLKRIMSRDKLSVEQARLRLDAQLPLIKKIKGAHEVITNEGSVPDLERDVASLLARLLARA